MPEGCCWDIVNDVSVTVMWPEVNLSELTFCSCSRVRSSSQVKVTDCRDVNKVTGLLGFLFPMDSQRPFSNVSHSQLHDSLKHPNKSWNSGLSMAMACFRPGTSVISGYMKGIHMQALHR